ncbi:hypothetical protein N8760_05085 [Rhodobacteraceae bacterium]|nr:hypothetical protein [Paracoccaceae bacterium]
MPALKKFLCVAISMAVLVGCQTTSEPVVDYSSQNVISYRYHAYDLVPTLPAKVRDMAQSHCEQFGKNAVYKGGKPVNIFTTEEIHDFTCEVGKVQLQNG